MIDREPKEKKFKGIEKVAIMMLSLPEEQVQKIFELLDSDEIRQISTTMINLGKIKSYTVENTFMDFVNEISSTGSLIGSLESTERLLLKVLPPEQADLIMEEIRGPAGRTLWDKLSNVNEETLANYLKNEYPQTVAVVLSRIRPENAAKILSLLPEQFAIEVIMRLLRMESVRKEILENIEDTLRQEFMSNLARSSRRDTHEIVAEIYNHFDRTSESRFLKSLEDKNPESAERVRSLMFTFDDLENLDNNAIQALMRAVDKNKLTLALKGATEVMRNIFFGNMSERASKLMQDDMKQMGMVRLRDVEEAQSYIVSIAKELASSGAIFIARGKEQGDQLVG